MPEKRTIKELVRENVLSLTPYSSAREEFTGKADVWLDANECPYPYTLRLMVEEDNATYGSPWSLTVDNLNRYPDPWQQELKVLIAAEKELSPDQVFLGNGSDEILDLLFRTFCEPGRDTIMLCPPSYGMYAVLADIHGIPILEVPLDEHFQPDVRSILDRANDHTKMIMLASPNNPTGNTMEKERVEALLKNFDGLVVVDEAYIDFAPEKSVLPLVGKYDNLMVLQTFSKARGGAGIRLGMGFACKEILRWLDHIKLPYNVNRLSAALATGMLKDHRRLDESVREIVRERQKLTGILTAFPWIEKVFPSDANFILVCPVDPERIYHALLSAGIVVRMRSSIPGCGNALRITVGTPEENKRLVETLKSIDL